MYQATTVYFLSDLIVLLKMSTACDTPIQRYLWFVQGAAFAMRERKETPFFYAQMKTRNYSPQAEWANWPQPTGCTRRRTTRDNRLVS